ncbi:hypothetical protein L9F63_018045, partial [Diploptera punctata]
LPCQAIDDGVEEEEEEERKPSRKKVRKRKRKDDDDGSGASTSTAGNSATATEPAPPKKRRGRPPLDKTIIPSISKHKKQMKKLMTIVIKYTDRDGRILSGPFMKLPSKQELPHYYNIIKKPMDIKKIQQRLDENKYAGFDDLERDFIQMCRNAQKYNEELSLIHEDSIVLEKVFVNARARLEQDTDPVDDEEEEEEEETTEETTEGQNACLFQTVSDKSKSEVSMCQPAVEEEGGHSDNDSMKVRIKLKGRKSESSGRKSIKKSEKKITVVETAEVVTMVADTASF